jgi:hypothetical protein
VQVTSLMLSLLREANEQTKRQMIIYDTHRTDLLAVMTAALTCDSVALYGIVPRSHRLTDYYLVTRGSPRSPPTARQQTQPRACCHYCSRSLLLLTLGFAGDGCGAQNFDRNVHAAFEFKKQVFPHVMLTL